MAEPILIAQHGETQCLLYPGKATQRGHITGAADNGALGSTLVTSAKPACCIRIYF
jgi:hypothetical protein